MVELNEAAKAYMVKYERKHIVLNLDIVTS